MNVFVAEPPIEHITLNKFLYWGEIENEEKCVWLCLLHNTTVFNTYVAQTQQYIFIIQTPPQSHQNIKIICTLKKMNISCNRKKNRTFHMLIYIILWERGGLMLMIFFLSYFPNEGEKALL